MKLSNRMEAIAAMVTPGGRLADIGTDHAYVPIALLERGIMQSAIAMDVRSGPLARARAHIADAGLTERIDTRLSDGLSDLAPQEADTIILAGMGGMLIRQILSNGRVTAHSARELVLQPQSDLAVLRRFLQEDGYRILDEDMICEDGKYYTVIKVTGSPHTESDDLLPERNGKRIGGWTDAEAAYGPVLLAQKHPVLKEYLQKEEKQLQRLLTELTDAAIHKADEEVTQSDAGVKEQRTDAQKRIIRRRRELMQRLECCRQALHKMEG